MDQSYRPQYKKVQESFRISIRRQQIDNYFRSQRIKMIEDMLTINQMQLQEQLNTYQKKQEWIRQKGIQFTGYPSYQWFNPLTKIQRSIKLFDKNFSLWVKHNIFCYITQTFKQQHKDLKLSALSARILYTIIYLDSSLIDKLMDYEFIPNVIQLCYDLNADVSQIIQYLILLSGIAYISASLKNKVNKQGGLQLILYFSQKNIIHIQLLENIFFLLQNLLKVFPQEQKLPKYPTYNQISVVLPIINHYIKQPASQRVLLNIIHCLEQMVYQARQITLTTLSYCQNIPRGLIESITHKNLQIRLSTIKILSYITTAKKVQISRNWLRLGLLDKLSLCLRLSPNNQNIINLTFSCINNIAANSRQDAQILFEHQIFQIVYQNAHVGQPIKNIKNAVYLLTTIIITGGYNICQKLIKDHQLFDLFIHLLSWSKDKQLQITKQILHGFKQLIIIYNEVYNYNSKNKIIDILVTIYNFGFVLDELLNHKNKSVSLLASIVIDLIQQ